ncbi:MAG TPA: hypothetical protein VHV54_24205 [Candidatus Binatia bacterium]|nr:hypothetical protein [Candidatus Binatia bacterium]
MDGKDERQCLLQVVEDAPPGSNRCDDSKEVVVEQNQRRGFARDIGAASPIVSYFAVEAILTQKLGDETM